jgi:cytochrome P450
MDTTTGTELPAFPGQRSGRCPLDPPVEYAQWLDEAGPVRAVWRGRPMWIVSRYSDVRAALSDPRVSADDRTPGFPIPATLGSQAPQSFIRMDDPEHAQIRRTLTGEFTVKRMRGLQPGIQETVDRFLDQMIDQGAPADLVRDFALPIPSAVISRMLGVPYAEHEFFQSHSATIVSATATDADRQAASQALFGYLLELVERKERDPGEDLISRQLERVAAGEIGRETVVVNAVALLVAGHETTANMIALGTLALLERPAQADRLRNDEDPGLVANAVEELLRYLTIPQDAVYRVAAEDLTIGDQLIRAGEAMVMNLPAANRDAAFTEGPNAVDLDRDVRGHLAFGYGTHQCLGQALARVELQIALPTLLRRLPNLQVTVPIEQLAFRNGTLTYGVRELPVTW